LGPVISRRKSMEIAIVVALAATLLAPFVLGILRGNRARSGGPEALPRRAIAPDVRASLVGSLLVVEALRGHGYPLLRRLDGGVDVSEGPDGRRKTALGYVFASRVEPRLRAAVARHGELTRAARSGEDVRAGAEELRSQVLELESFYVGVSRGLPPRGDRVEMLDEVWARAVEHFGANGPLGPSASPGGGPVGDGVAPWPVGGQAPKSEREFVDRHVEPLFSSMGYETEKEVRAAFRKGSQKRHGFIDVLASRGGRAVCIVEAKLSSSDSAIGDASAQAADYARYLGREGPRVAATVVATPRVVVVYQLDVYDSRELARFEPGRERGWADRLRSVLAAY